MTLKYVSYILQTEEAFTVEEYTRTQYHTQKKWFEWKYKVLTKPTETKKLKKENDFVQRSL